MSWESHAKKKWWSSKEERSPLWKKGLLKEAAPGIDRAGWMGNHTFYLPPREAVATSFLDLQTQSLSRVESRRVALGICLGSFHFPLANRQSYHGLDASSYGHCISEWAAASWNPTLCFVLWQRLWHCCSAHSFPDVCVFPSRLWAPCRLRSIHLNFSLCLACKRQ